MNFEIFADGKSVVKADVDVSTIFRLVAGMAAENPVAARSTPATAEQMAAVMDSIDPRSAQFLRELALDASGSIRWRRMTQIFGIERWPEFSGSFGKGITRAFRHTLNDKTAKLFWWDDNTWDDEDDNTQLVFVDGPALAALRHAN